VYVLITASLLTVSPMRQRTPNPADQIELFKRLVKYSVYDEEEFVQIPTVIAVAIASMLDRVPKPRGRQRIRGRDRVQEATVIILALARKDELIAAGMPKGKAAEEAAEWAAAQLRKTRNLSATTIKRLMQRRR
jgi:hypothetical protein